MIIVNSIERARVKEIKFLGDIIYEINILEITYREKTVPNEDTMTMVLFCSEHCFFYLKKKSFPEHMYCILPLQ